MKAFSILALAGAASAQSLASVLQGAPETTQLQAAVAAVPGLLEALAGAKDITILAPNNAAFEAFVTANGGPAVLNATDIVRAVLEYHVLNGTVKAADITGAPGPLFPRTLLNNATYENVDGAQYLEAAAVNGSVKFFSGLLKNSTVVTPDITFDGGVIHLIDSVLTLPANVTATATAGGLTQLASALQATKLLETVNNTPNITIFAPVDAAFAAIQSVLSAANTSTIASVLEYHVVPGVIFSTGLSAGAQVPTLLNGSSLTVNQEGSTFFINDAAIVKANILIQNGVVHLIDSVLNPSNATAAPAKGATAGSVQYGGASAANSTSGSGSSSGSPSSTSGASPSGTSSASGSSSSAAAQSTGGAIANKAYPIAGVLAAGAAFLL